MIARLRSRSAVTRGFVALVILFATTVAIAQDKTIAVESSPMQPSVALGRPMLTWWDVKIKGLPLITGQFKFILKSEAQVLATAETDELTLNGPEQRIRVLLPAISGNLERVNVDIEFKGKNYSGTLAPQILRVPFAGKKVFVTLVGEPRLGRKKSPERQKILASLKFEAHIPKVSRNQSDDDDHEFVKTFSAILDPTDFPTDPLAYCGYDLIALLGEEFRALRKPQLEAILAWVKAGGSLYLEPNDVLESYHVEFLRNLVAGDPQELVVQVDASGRLEPAGIAAVPARVIRCGLGTTVLRVEEPDREIDLTSREWDAVVTSLWKWRTQPVPNPAYRATGNDVNGNPMFLPSVDPWSLSQANNPFRLPNDHLLDRLLPEGFRMVPGWLLTLILFAFVILIGPGDYFVLGLLRARSLTWVTFPLAAVLVTVLTVWLSNRYMAKSETRRGVVLCDIDRSGQIVRTNRLELLFVVSTHRVVTDVQKGLFTALQLQQKFSGDPFSNRGQFRVQKPIGQDRFGQPIFSDDLLNPNLAVTPYQGRIPTQFSSTQDLVKWTPQLNRIFWIPGSVTAPEVDWSAFDLREFEALTIRRHVIPERLSEIVKQKFGPDAMVACFTGRDWAYDKAAGWRSSRTQNPSPGATYYPPPISMNVQTNPSAPQSEPEFLQWIYQASASVPVPGTTMLTAQSAPKGGATCDDLPLLDSSDPKAWLLVVVVPENGDFVTYRKLMQFKN